jgi:predicted esterase
MGPHAGQPVLAAGAPLDRARAALILVHGRGAGPENILELAPALEAADVAYLAPAAAGHTWYPFSFMSDTARNEPGLSSGLHVLGQLVARIEGHGIPKTRQLLLGFSQGACLAGEFAVRTPGAYGGIIMLSGGLIGPPGTTWRPQESFAGTPVFLGCSDVDPHIPLVRVDESAQVFQRAGAQVTRRVYPGLGHLVNEDELAFVRTLISQTLTG